MIDFFKNLFSNSNFMPHGTCYLWQPEILWMHVISDLIIAIAYYSIPLALGIIILKRRTFPFRWLIGLFAAFIILCGTTHIIGIITQWNPIYRVQGLLKLMTAAVSIATAIVIYPLLPKLLAAGEELAERIERDVI